MSPITIFAASVFGVGLALGYSRYPSRAWNWVDIVYYPLAAIGVALLFLSGATQRSLLQVEERIEQNSNAMKLLQANRPSVQGIPPKELVDTSFGLVAGIVELADVCAKVPRMDPTCSVAEKMRSAAAEFSKVAASAYDTQELRLATACAAGDTLVAKLRTAESMSSLVGDELAAQIAEARSRDRYYLDYSATARDAESFERRARERVAAVRSMIADKSEAMTYVFSVNEAEIKAASTVIHALYPCVVVPRAKIEPLANWTVQRQSQETERARLEELKRQVQSTPAMSRSLQWMQLNLWPFVLVAGLALKFAKGVATVRKNEVDKRTKEQSMANAPRQAAIAASSPEIASAPVSQQPQPPESTPR